MKTIKSFIKFIKEQYYDILDKTPIYQNPSRSDIVEIFKNSKHKEARFLSIPSKNLFLIWDADKLIHIQVFNFLKRKGVIPSYLDFYDYYECFGGVAKIKAGDLYYYSSDELDFYVYEFQKPEHKRRESTNDKIDYFFANALNISKEHSLVSQYINDFDGPENPFLKIHNLLHK